MAYTAEQIAAFVGAAAWLPQVGTWAYNYFRRPEITLIPDISAEIGYSIFGPIFNIRLAISTSMRDVLLNDFLAELTHEAGEKRVFHWRGTKETLNQIRDASGIRETVEREGAAIAVKVRPDMMVDQVFRMQDLNFQNQAKVMSDELQATALHYLASQPSVAKDKIESSDKLESWLSYFRTSFNWRPGRYAVRFSCKSIGESVRLNESEYKFNLTSADVELLRKNFDKIKEHFLWTLFKGVSTSNTPEPSFSWVYPQILR